MTRGIDDDDLSVWQAEIEDVRPRIKERPAATASDEVEELFPEHSGSRERVQTDGIEDIEAAVPVPVPPLFAPVEPSDLAGVVVQHNRADMIRGSANGVDVRTMKKLAGGQIAFTDRLDLHGFYETEAWAAVQDFLHEAYGLEHRCVLVIHGKGKGYGEKGDMGVIKANMAGWLARHPRVLAFCTAHKKDGGRGAIYVYLRRRR